MGKGPSKSSSEQNRYVGQARSGPGPAKCGSCLPIGQVFSESWSYWRHQVILFTILIEVCFLGYIVSVFKTLLVFPHNNKYTLVSYYLLLGCNRRKYWKWEDKSVEVLQGKLVSGGILYMQCHKLTGQFLDCRFNNSHVSLMLSC